MNRFIARALRAVFGNFAVWRIFMAIAPGSGAVKAHFANSPMRLQVVDRTTIEGCADGLLRDQAWYCGAGCEAFGCLVDSTLVGVCFFWHGERYTLRDFWPLAEREAMLVQIVTSVQARGRGVAGVLIPFATEQMTDRGFDRLFARVWYSNQPSWKAFSRAGWLQVATLVEIDPMRSGSPWRWVRRRRMADSAS